jgi:membrane fusion protein, copper/silver efflux system
MKRAVILILVALVVVTGAVLITRNRSERAKEQRAARVAPKPQPPKDIYYCPMHPTVTSDHPGHCPICGMTLVKRATSTGGTSVDPAVAAVALSPEQRVTANVRTQRIELQTHTGEIVTTGRVTFDERRLAQVTSYTAGRIERLAVNFTGDTVRRGEVVATIYSPELFSAQQEYMLAVANAQRMRNAGFSDARSASRDLVESSRRRLMLLGMTAGQIAQLERGGKAPTTTPIVATVNGVVTKKLVVPQQYVETGQPLLEVADLSRVWVEADVYEQQLPDIRIGQQVAITSPAVPGQEFAGTVAFIQPVLEGSTRTATVRVDMPNPGLRLKPDMYVSVRLYGLPTNAHIMVPASAVVDRGQSKFVWVEGARGSFEPREVTVGPRHGEQIVISSGLKPGDNIVIEGGFLLDSEAQLRGATSTPHTEHQP